jgi:hypothetical protein
MPPERAATGAAVRSVGMPARRGSQGMSASGAQTGLSVRVAPSVPIDVGWIVAEGATIAVSGLPVRDSPLHLKTDLQADLVPPHLAVPHAAPGRRASPPRPA